MREQFSLNFAGGGIKRPAAEATPPTPEESDHNADLQTFSKEELEIENNRLLEMRVRFQSSEPDTVGWINDRLTAITELLKTNPS